MKPIVSVVMAIHRGKIEEVELSINSILNQTFDDIEFIIVDDINDELLSEYLASLGRKFSNVFIVKNTENIGLTFSLIKAIDLASGKYIARQDADDISHIERIDQQVRYLQKNINVVLLGTGYTLLDKTLSIRKEVIVAKSHDELLELMFKINPFCHSSVMFRKETYQLAGGYSVNFKLTQDLDLWFRLLDFGRFAILDKNLVTRCISSSSLSKNFNNAFQQNWNGLILRLRERNRSRQKYMGYKIFLTFFRSIIIIIIPATLITFIKKSIFNH